MKKRLFFMSNQSGFFLPYVLFVSAFLLIIVTANINIYNQDIRITENHLEQIKMETLVQMGRMQFKEEIESHQNDKGEVGYTFRDGRVTITYTKLNESEYDLLFTVNTRKNHNYVLMNYLNVSHSGVLEGD